MANLKGTASYATMIGDLVGSRRSDDRRALHRRVTEALAGATARIPPATPLDITAGDEFQGTWATLGEALQAAFWLQVHLLPDAPARFGIGWGEVTLLDAERGTQDGPGWWAARAAIEAAADFEERPGLRRVRTAYRRAGEDGPAPEAINAALTCRDQLIGALDERSLRILSGLLDGTTRAALATQEGISGSAVSQRVTRDGLEVIIAASHHLRDVR